MYEINNLPNECTALAAADKIRVYDDSADEEKFVYADTLAVYNQVGTTLTVAGPTNDVDVTGVSVVFTAGATGPVVIGGFVGGVNGQVLHVVSTETTHGFTLENAEAAGDQDIFLSAEADTSVATKGGGIILVCDGSNWYEAAK